MNLTKEAPTYENILVELDGGVAVVVINRPEKLNALSHRVIEDLLDALEAIAEDDEVRAVVLTGAGRAFCAGDDISGTALPGRRRHGEAASTWLAHRNRQHALLKSLIALRKPTIAMINGFAHGAGSDLALACDYRIADAQAMMGDIRGQRAIHPGTGAAWLLPRIVGLTASIEILFTGRTFPGTEAERIGMVNKAVPADELRAVTMALAQQLAAGPTKHIGIVKGMIYRQLSMDFATALDDAMLVYAEPVEDSEEGMRSFREKRSPQFTGR